MDIIESLEDRYLKILNVLPIDVKLTFLTNHINFSSKIKIITLKNILESPFLNHENVTLAFCNIKKIENAMNILKRNWKWRKSKIYNTEDLYMNPIHISDRNVLVLLQNNMKYVFHLKELIHVIQTSLSHCSHFFPEPIDCKNPYTNIPFNVSALYAIYFSIRQSSYKIPPLFEAFFQSNFNYNSFLLNNEYLINNEYLNTYVENNCVENVLIHVQEMFNYYHFRCNVHKSFPSEKLMRIMKPYLELYYISQYSLSANKQIKYHKILHSKLYKFITYNPYFGRRKVKLVKTNPFSHTGTCEYYFDEKHISFHTKVYNQANSHLSSSYLSTEHQHQYNLIRRTHRISLGQQESSDSDEEPQIHPQIHPQTQSQPQSQTQSQSQTQPQTQIESDPETEPYDDEDEDEEYNREVLSEDDTIVYLDESEIDESDGYDSG